MSDDKKANLSQEEIDQLVAESDTGGRKPSPPVLKAITFIAFSWAFFQVWIASPLPFTVGFGIFNSSEARSIHLFFSVLLAYLLFPARKSSPKNKIPIVDIALALIGAFSALYIFMFYTELAERPNAANTTDVVVSVIGGLTLLEACRRALGMPLVIIASVFIAYTFAGPYMPGVLAWKGDSLAGVAYHQWLSTEGVFGIALGVSTGFVFLFVLFGALLEKVGGGEYFIRLAFSLMGKYRGGPAKAAVIGSALTGLISGSSIANVVTTGTFTIPLMRKNGIPVEKAGAIEVASSVNGQIMPPVMGAAAFLMIEYVGIPYIEVIKHAFLPAFISYIALFYIVHLEALKLGLKPSLQQGVQSTLAKKLFKFVTYTLLTLVLAFAVYYGLGWIKAVAGSFAWMIIMALLGVTYLGTIKYCSKFEDIPHDLDSLENLPPAGVIFMSGLYFILPVVVLIWCLMVERLSPGLSAFYGVAFLSFEIVTLEPLKAFFRQKNGFINRLITGAKDLYDAMAVASRNMIGIGIATAVAGIIVGAVSQTGVGGVLSSIVETLSFGNVFLMLFLTAILCLILGMGLPTTANYIVVSSLLAPVILELGQANGLIIPLIAVHMFVFYFGIMADVTPPVGLASFAAAAISGGDAMKTGFTAFFYSLRTAVLPFIFVFNTDLLLIDVTWAQGIFVLITSIIGILLFTAATQGYLLVKNKLVEGALLLVLALAFLRPGLFLDGIYAPYTEHSGTSVVEAMNNIPKDQEIRTKVDGFDAFGVKKTFYVIIPPTTADGSRLSSAGLNVIEKDGKIIVESVSFDSAAQVAGFDFDQEILIVFAPTERPAKQLVYIPALLLFAFLYLMQKRRRKKEELLEAA